MILAGLPQREAVAMEMLVDKALPGWRCSAVAAGRRVPLPTSDLFVVDLAGRGLARWTQETQNELLTALNGTPAVLVMPAFDQSWLSFDRQQAGSQTLVLLHKPYGMQDMQLALKRAAPAPAPAARPVLAQKPPVPVQRQVPAEQTVRAPAPPAPPAPPATSTRLPIPSPAAPAEPVGTMTTDQFQTWLGALTDADSSLLWRKVGAALVRRRPFEVRLSVVTRWICDPVGEWVASNTQASVLAQLCQSDALAASIETDAIDGAPLERAQRLGLSSEPLGPFLWRLTRLRQATYITTEANRAPDNPTAIPPIEKTP